MEAYTAIGHMLDLADDFGEEQVIRDVAKRAGVMWECVNDRCALDNVGLGGTCEHCGWPAPDPAPRLGEWRCACMALNVDPTCSVCHRENLHFRSSQFYT